MRVSVNNQTLELSDKDLIGSGGQGQVFLKGKTAYKIYTDPQYMLPIGKISELSKIKHPKVIKPEEVISAPNGSPIGYTMSFVKGASPLCQLFTRPFRDAHSIGQDSIQTLVDTLTEIVHSAHSAKALLVDLNEMNFLAGGKKFDELYAIDVDSWQTPSYPAQAIMPSVRDPHTPKFNEGSDWYSFAIVTFQLYIGIHPYRGKHPTLKGFDDRMKANASVFGKDVRIPACCYPFEAIPAGLRAWYEKVFERGLRTAPGAVGTVVAMPAFVMPVPTSSASMSVTLVRTIGGRFIRVLPTATGLVFVHTNGIAVGIRQIVMKPPMAAFTGPSSVVCVGLSRNSLHIATEQHSCKQLIDNGAVIQFGERTVFKNDGTLLEIDILENKATKTFEPTFRTLCQVMPGAKAFAGCLIQEMLGAKVLIASPAPKTVYQPILQELQKFRVIDARLVGTVLMTVSEQKGIYYRHIFRFDAAFDGYDCRESPSTSIPSINFTVTPKGVVVMINEEDQILLFPAKVNAAGTKVVDAGSAVQSSDMLFMDGDKVMFARDETIYWMQIK